MAAPIGRTHCERDWSDRQRPVPIVRGKTAILLPTHFQSSDTDSASPESSHSHHRRPGLYSLTRG